MIVLIALGTCDFPCELTEIPRHDSVVSVDILQSETLRDLVKKEYGSFVGIKYGGAGWHPKHGELPRLELRRLNQMPAQTA